MNLMTICFDENVEIGSRTFPGISSMMKSDGKVTNKSGTDIIIPQNVRIFISLKINFNQASLHKLENH
jgi:hypothetical protein